LVVAEETDPVGRYHARERASTVDRLEHPAILAEQVLIRAFEHRAIDRRGEHVGRSHLGQRRSRAVDLGREGPLEGDDHAIGVDCLGADERAFDDPIRVVTQDGAVLERAWLALGAVDDDTGGRSTEGVGGDGLPLPTGGEAGAAAPAQPRLEHCADDFARAHAAGRLQPEEAAAETMLLERRDDGRVEDAPASRPGRSVPDVRRGSDGNVEGRGG
jgi:hypothetical protein